MQMEMEVGGKLFFDLFVAMCNHMVGFLLSLCLIHLLYILAWCGLLASTPRASSSPAMTMPGDWDTALTGSDITGRHGSHHEVATLCSLTA